MSARKNIIKSDLKKLDAISDQAINYSDIEAFDDAFFQRATLIDLPRAKDSVTLRVDHDVLEWFKEKGKGYQTRMNAVLKAYVKAHQ